MSSKETLVSAWVQKYLFIQIFISFSDKEPPLYAKAHSGGSL